MTGNSIAHFQANFGRQEFPAFPPPNVYIWGQDSMMCSGILPLILYLVPARTDVLVLIDSTNDIEHSVPISQHMSCMAQTITTLLGRNPALKIVVANTPPWTQYDPCSGTYRDHSIVQMIEAYNAAYADPATGLQAQWPNNVRVADVFTPSADQNGWAIPQYMSGPCGIHPGQEFQWSPSWQHFADGYLPLVTTAAMGRW
ncbi:MAG TPA: SGNH/GDSL hydrolase family protein [Candidatus Binatia bacterium]|nr:SGNH/GDSL hydrolase family protein [Candidatus Binatia bacterium]